MNPSSVLSRRKFLAVNALLAISALDASWGAEVEKRTVETDVCIYGGTSAGVIAAVQAAILGKRVLLLEPGSHFGGMSVEGLGGTDIDNHKEFQNSPAVGGLALEFYRRVSVAYKRESAFDDMIRANAKKGGLWSFEPHVAEAVFEQMLLEARVTALKRHRLLEKGGVKKDGTRIVSIECENGLEVRAKVFVDCTYEGDLMASAGVSFTVGREGNAKYGETKNGIRLDSFHSRLDQKVDPYKTPGDPQSGLIYGVSDEPLGEQGAPSDAIQGFSFRLCLTKNPENRLVIRQPVDYDAARYELQRRYLAAGGVITPPGANLPNGKTDPGSWHVLAGYLTGANHQWNTASYAERERLLQESLEYVKGLHWFLSNDPQVPAAVRAQWSEWGPCKDEFRDNGGWPRMFYVRNGRRMISDFVETEAHGRRKNPEPIEDPIGIICWPHDLHNARRVIRDGAVWNEGAVFNSKEPDWIPFGQSYRTIVPKASECTNLLAPTCPSMSYVAYGAFRLEFSFMVSAQGAATAAALAIDRNIKVQAVPYPVLREQLLKDGAVLGLSQVAIP